MRPIATLTALTVVAATLSVLHASAQDKIGNWNVAVIFTNDAQHQAQGGAGLKDDLFTIRAGGDDIWNAADQFTFVYQEVSGDFDMSIAVHRLERTNDWSKAGIMARQTLEPNSVNVLAATRGAENLVTFQQRPVAGAASTSRRIIQDAPGFAFPVGILLKKTGNVFSGDWSEGGDTNWSGDPRHNDGTPTGMYTVKFTDPYYVGIAVTSHTAGVITEADVEVLEASFALAVQPSGKAATTWGALKGSAR
ncbi:MAG: hypothetical protein O3A46_04110 [Candidatus Poribacteria bacterium]|nr:hypothetical protein [Candidatus Poribacteria bacterium]